MAVNDLHEAGKTSSAEIVGSIDDLLTKIFLRLPMKSLIRFQSVSKHWRFLISDPGFCILRNPDPNPAIGFIFQYRCRTHPDLCNASRPMGAYVVSFDKSSSTTSPPFRKLEFTKDPLRWDTNILNSCNGLLLCKSGDNMRYWVCNLTTNQYALLPELPDERVRRMYLAFDPSKSPCYKVVCVQLLGVDRRQCRFEVYSSETGSWGKPGEPFTADVDFGDGVYWNGAIHWISFCGGESIYFKPDDDDDDQTAKVMPTPPPILNDWYLRDSCYFGESCGHLHYIEVYRTVSELDVYEMRRDYSEWFLKYRVDLPGVVECWFSICTLVLGDKDEDAFLVLQEDNRILRYNLVCRTFETLHELEYPCAQFPLPYIESLCYV